MTAVIIDRWNWICSVYHLLNIKRVCVCCEKAGLCFLVSEKKKKRIYLEQVVIWSRVAILPLRVISIILYNTWIQPDTHRSVCFWQQAAAWSSWRSTFIMTIFKLWQKRKITGNFDVELRTICVIHPSILEEFHLKAVLLRVKTPRKPLAWSAASLLKGFVKFHNLSWISDTSPTCQV